MKKKSVGIVKTQHHHLSDDLVLEGGSTLSQVTIAYETYGELNKDKSNVILVCHALSGDAHAAGWHKGDKKPGWWDILIGPGKALDTTKYFVVCSNVIGGCKGSTGPSSINPKMGRPYGLDFPMITTLDMVNAQKKLIDHLGAKQLFAVIGGSSGGMQVLQWCVSHPEMVRLAIPIATAAYSSPQQIAFNEVGRRAIISDPNWNNGDYYSKSPPTNGLALARMIGHITYLSDESMYQKFGRKLQYKEKYGFDFSTDFQVESYLHHQGDVFVKRFDANSYLYITKAIDYFDLSQFSELRELQSRGDSNMTKNGSLAENFKKVKAKFLVISITSDWLYPPYQSEEIVMALSANDIDVTYHELTSNYGHDAFLLEAGQLNYAITNFLSHQLAGDVMTKDIATIREGSTIEKASEIMMERGVTHLPVVSKGGQLIGIVTAWDISKAVALKYSQLDEIMTKDVITSKLDEPIEVVAKKMDRHDISALPIVDEHQKVIGILTSDGISKLIRR